MAKSFILAPPGQIHAIPGRINTRCGASDQFTHILLDNLTNLSLKSLDTARIQSDLGFANKTSAARTDHHGPKTAVPR